MLLYFYGRAIQGAYAFHKIEKQENPDYQATPKWFYYIGIPSLVILTVFMGIGLMTMTGALPSTEVQVGADVAPAEKQLLVTNRIISERDNIQYFYSVGLASVLEGGSILTDERIILYLPSDTEEIEAYEIYFEDITSIELISEGDLLNNSVYQINSYTPDA